MIDKGFILLARSIQDSPIANCPPYVREIWIYLLLNANHKDKIHKGNSIKRGQLFRTYEEIREALSWKIGYRKMMYHENHTKHGMKILRDYHMIDTTKQLGGVLITVLNYDKFQDVKNYETTNETTNEPTILYRHTDHTPPDNNKNEKELKNEKNGILIVGAPPTPSQEAKEFFENEEKQKACIDMLVARGAPEDIAKNELRKFVNHWTEPTLNGRRQRWQTEKAFEIKRRLATWLNNSAKWSNKTPQFAARSGSITNDPNL